MKRIFYLTIILITALNISCADLLNDALDSQNMMQEMFHAGDKQTFIADGVSFNMVYVPPKTFPTGTDDSGTGTVDNPYWIGETEVTQLWQKVYTWATSNGYTFANAGNMGDGAGVTNQHPVTFIN